MKIKKIFLLALVVLTGIASSCKYDDDEIWDTVDNLADRVTALEELTKKLNGDIVAMQSIVSALEKNISIASVEEVADGYIIHFTDGTKATIKHGKDGADGKDGVDGTNGKDGADGKDGTDGKDGVNGTNGKDGKDGLNAPIIGVAKYEGAYYWNITIDGETEWLTDEEGNKFPVTSNGGQDGNDGKDGKDGITPLIKVDTNGIWFVSYDNGTTWTSLGVSATTGPTGPRGDSAFADNNPIEVRDGIAYFTLADGTVFEIPVASTVEYTLNGADFNANATQNLSGTITLNYTVNNMANASVEILKQENATAVADENAKTITITPIYNGNQNGKVVILFYNSNQTITSVLNFNIQ